MGHQWRYISLREIPSDVGIIKAGDCWVCDNCQASSHDVDSGLSWIPSDRPPNDVWIETYDSKHAKYSCEEMAVSRVHAS